MGVLDIVKQWIKLEELELIRGIFCFEKQIEPL